MPSLDLGLEITSRKIIGGGIPPPNNLDGGNLPNTVFDKTVNNGFSNTNEFTDTYNGGFA
jgi:hypothetical protein